MKAKTKGESQNVREGVHVRLKAEGGRMKNALNSPSFILHPSAFSLGFRLPSRSGYRLCTSFFLSFVLLAQAVFATLPTVPPAKVAMSAERLAVNSAAARGDDDRHHLRPRQPHQDRGDGDERDDPRRARPGETERPGLALHP